MNTSEALKELNISICECSATQQEKELMLNDLKVLIISLIKKEENECL